MHSSSLDLADKSLSWLILVFYLSGESLLIPEDLLENSDSVFLLGLSPGDLLKAADFLRPKGS
jgi:hypothetical protein